MDRPPAQAPRSAYYDGWTYAAFIDRLSAGLYRRVAERVPADLRVLDAACGSGALALRLAARCRQVVGVDLSPRQIRQARRALARSGADNVRFELGDAARLDRYADGHFDQATAVMAIHEMPAGFRPAVLAELGRVARQVLVVDFAAPLPRNLAGLGQRLVEMIAGPRHFLSFLDYQRRGGLEPLAAEAGLTAVDHKVWGGTLDVVSLRA